MKDLWPMIYDVWPKWPKKIQQRSKIKATSATCADLRFKPHPPSSSFSSAKYFGCHKYCLHWFGTKMLSSTKDLFSFRSYIYHMTKWTKYIFLRMDWTFLLLTGTFWGGLGMKGVFGLSNNTVFITWISLFWKEIYISRQLNLFLRTMFVVVGLSFVTTTLNG